MFFLEALANDEPPESLDDDDEDEEDEDDEDEEEEEEETRSVGFRGVLVIGPNFRCLVTATQFFLVFRYSTYLIIFDFWMMPRCPNCSASQSPTAQ